MSSHNHVRMVELPGQRTRRYAARLFDCFFSEEPPAARTLLRGLELSSYRTHSTQPELLHCGIVIHANFRSNVSSADVALRSRTALRGSTMPARRSLHRAHSECAWGMKGEAKTVTRSCQAPGKVFNSHLKVTIPDDVDSLPLPS